MKLLINFFTLTILIIAIIKNIVAYPSQNISNFDATLRMVEGKKAKDAQFPFVAYLALKHRSKVTIECVGSLISYSAILTAAQCVYGVTSAEISLGARDVSRYSIERTVRTVYSEEFITYPGFNKTNLRHDIGIVKLPYSEMVNEVLSDHIKVIHILSRDDMSCAGLLGTTMGWGTTNIDQRNLDLTTLRYERDTILANSACQRMALDEYKIYDTQICLSGQRGSSPCLGDSGAPLIVEHIQVGVLSFNGDSDCRPGSYAVFTRISKYLAWIRANS